MGNALKTILFVMSGLALLSGCATSTMKSTPFYTGDVQTYTGRAEDRVNLWPVGYYREPALSVLWPMFSLTDDHFAIRPVYSQYRQTGKGGAYDEFNLLWPFCQVDTEHDRHRVIPVFWGGDSFTLFPIVWWKRDRWFNVFPIWWSDQDSDMLLPVYYRDADTFATPLFGWNDRSSWVVPLYYTDDSTFATLPFVCGDSHDARYWSVPLLFSWGTRSLTASSAFFLLGMGGASYETDGLSRQWALPFFYHDDTSLMTALFGYDRAKNGSWIFPCYYDDDDTFLSAAYWRNRSTGADGSRTFEHGTFPFWYASDDLFLSPLWISHRDEQENADGWFAPPVLTWGRTKGNARETYFLFGLGGSACDSDGRTADWIVPFFYRDDTTLVSLPWCVWDDEWKSGYLTLLYGRNRTKESNPDVDHVVPPLLSLYRTRRDGSSAFYTLLGLGAWTYDKEGNFDRSWLFPLWWVDKHEFFSLPFQYEEDSHTAVAFVFGVKHGKSRTGAWAWPLYGRTDHRSMPEAEAMLNADRLDPRVTVKQHERVTAAGTNCWYSVQGGVSADDESWVLSCSREHRISWLALLNGTVVGTERREIGNVLAFQAKSRREVAFDPTTRRKLSDTEEGSSRLFGNLVWSSEYRKRDGRTVSSMKSLFWRFWHREEKDGVVFVDAFPFFTYDSKPNGYAKTSLLWRLFWNENDPNKGCATDVLFIPVHR